MAIIGKPVEILMVEDNESDVGLIEEVLEEVRVRSNHHVVTEEFISVVESIANFWLRIVRLPTR